MIFSTTLRAYIIFKSRYLYKLLFCGDYFYCAGGKTGACYCQ